MENNQPAGQTPENNDETIFSGEDFALQGYDKHIRQARNAIFIVAGLLVINLIIFLVTIPEGYEFWWIDTIVWGAFIACFVGLALWTKRKPYFAIIGALILYIGFIALNAVLDITTLSKGIIMKVIIFIFLIKGINDAREAQQIKEQLGK